MKYRRSSEFSPELKVAGPSMLGIGCPDRHALPHFTPSMTHRAPQTLPSRASGFVRCPKGDPYMTHQNRAELVDFGPSPNVVAGGKRGPTITQSRLVCRCYRISARPSPSTFRCSNSSGVFTDELSAT